MQKDLNLMTQVEPSLKASMPGICLYGLCYVGRLEVPDKAALFTRRACKTADNEASAGTCGKVRGDLVQALVSANNCGNSSMASLIGVCVFWI